MSKIPPDVLDGLNEGRVETITLVEWLAIDIGRLVRAVAPQVGIDAASPSVIEAADRLVGEGVSRRSRGMGEAVHRALEGHPRREEIFEALATHPSDMVRAWAAYSLAADAAPALRDRLRAIRRFASDRSIAVRECAWEAFRSHLAADLERGVRLLRAWVRDPDPRIRRCAVEGTRPRGVWTSHIEALKEKPDLALPLLEPVRSDPSDYVRRAVANWINDASKSRPSWARKICARWKRESPTKETAWIVNRALRTLRKEAGRRR